MVDTQLSKLFDIKSSIQNYSVWASSSASATLAEIWREGDVLVVDSNVAKMHEDLRSFISGRSRVYELVASESLKSYRGLIPLFERLLADGVKRNNRLIAVGGGIIQDVTGFISTVLFRGVEWSFIPSTLLAQGDSCIGSKTSINFGAYKNQLGSFRPPSHIYIVPHLLTSLSDRDVRSGVGEMAHYFFVSGPEDVDFFQQHVTGSLGLSTDLKEVISRSLAIKKSYIEVDEFDKKERVVFNYGHTFGHALESISNYGIPHGVAVCFGMDLANYVSMRKGYLKDEEFLFARNVFLQIWGEFALDDVSIDGFMDALEKDKKNIDGMIGLILTRGWGDMFLDLTPPDAVFKNWMQDYLTSYH